MTTVVTISGGGMGLPDEKQRVTESAKDVVDEVNGALAQKLKFVALTDAGSGKQVSIQASQVRDIAEE